MTIKLLRSFSPMKFYHHRKLNEVIHHTCRNFSLDKGNLRASYSKEKPDLLGRRVVVPGNCRKLPTPIAEIDCRVALIVGGSRNGFGYVAAEQLLLRGARRVVLTDSEREAGALAVKSLCKAFGQDRAKFYPCDVKNSCHLEGIFASSFCRNENVSIVFNDIDAIQSDSPSCMKYCKDAVNISNTQRITRIVLDSISRNCPEKEKGAKIIINCASILGFMGWPDNPEPVYCRAEPAIQTTIDMAKSFPGAPVRLVALCPANRPFENIGLPDCPEEKDPVGASQVLSDLRRCENRSCEPDPRRDRNRVGQSLAHLLARAQTGSVWLLEPPFTLREKPRLLMPTSGDASNAEQVCPVSLHA